MSEHGLVEIEYAAPRAEHRNPAGWRYYCSCGARGPYHHERGFATAPRERERCESLARMDFNQHKRGFAPAHTEEKGEGRG